MAFVTMSPWGSRPQSRDDFGGRICQNSFPKTGQKAKNKGREVTRVENCMLEELPWDPDLLDRGFGILGLLFTHSLLVLHFLCASNLPGRVGKTGNDMLMIIDGQYFEQRNAILE